MSDSFKNNAAQNREKPEPTEGSRPVPWIVLLIISSLFIWSIGYIVLTHQQAPAQFGDRRSAADFITASSSGGNIDAAKIYTSHCVACHQANGMGVPGAFPPLSKSEWVNGEPKVLVQILLHGIEGEITVAGNTYNSQMPEFGNSLSDDEIAALTSYIRSNFDNNSDAIDAEFIKEQRTSIDRSTPWGGEAELKQLLN